MIIVCQDAAATIGPACASVAWADELIVVDSGSTDETVEIVRRHTDRVIHEPWRGYTEQKQFAADLCSHDWVLILDSDEEVSEALAGWLKAWSAEEGEGELAGCDVADMPRENYVMGRHVRAWGPDRQARLFHRGRAVWREDALHDTLDPSPGGRLAHLDGPLLHKRHSDGGFDDYFSGRRMDSRLMLVARDLDARGKRAGLLDLVFRPPMAFLKFLLIKGGWRDGVFGLLIAQKAWVSVQLKYAALWSLQRERRRRGAGPGADRG
ncbi:MAG: glycosyltransferase family 2 protein [Planctomycetota bacterium]